MRQLFQNTSVVALTAILLLGTSSSGTAQTEVPPAQSSAPSPAEPEPLSAEEALVIDGKSYAARFGVPLEEAMRRVSLMAGTGEEIAALSQEFGDEVSGIYFDNASNFGLKVRLTGQERRAARRLQRSDIRATRQADRQAVRTERQAGRQEARVDRRAARQALRITDAEVTQAGAVLAADTSTTVEFIPGAQKSRQSVREAVRSRFAEISQLLPKLEGVAYDEQKGAVIVQVVGNATTVTDAIKTPITAIFEVPVEFEFTTRPLAPVAARGGTSIIYSTGGLNCTAAFFAYDASNRPGLLTAGHCYAIQNQDLFYTDTDGRRYQLIIDNGLNLYTDKEDVLFLRFPTGLTGSPQFFANRGEAARALTGRRSLGATNVASGTAQGTYVCFYGMTSGPVHGQGCGDVKYKEFASSTASSGGKMQTVAGPSYYVQVQGPSSTLRCGPGDSGAPWFVYNIAFGIMSACAENMIGTNSVANYTSTDAAYARNYRLAY